MSPLQRHQSACGPAKHPEECPTKIVEIASVSDRLAEDRSGSSRRPIHAPAMAPARNGDGLGDAGFATNRSLPDGARVVCGPSSRVPPLTPTPEVRALGYLSIH
jgi:hypothetical protein